MRKLLLFLVCIALLSPLVAETNGPRGEAGELRLAAGRFRPDAQQFPPAWSQAKPEARSARDRRYLVAITAASLSVEQRRLLGSAGAELLDYIPVNGYRIRVAPGAEARVRALPFVTWLGELPPHFKVEPKLLEPSAPAGSAVRIRVVLASDEPNHRVLGALDNFARTAVPSGRGGAWRVEALVPAEGLAAVISKVSALPEVEAVERAHEIRPLNLDAAWVHQSFDGVSTPIFDGGLFGCGQVVAVADTGQDYGSCYFEDPGGGDPPFEICVTPPCPAGTPNPSLRKDIIYYNWSGTPTGDDDTCPSLLLEGSGHGTHTSGSVAGDKAPYLDCSTLDDDPDPRNSGDGLAPGAKLVIQEMGDGVEFLNNLGGTIWNLADVAYQSGARIHSFSFGGVCHDLLGFCVPGCTLPYDSLARDADLAMWTYPDLLLVNAAGNAGGLCSPPNSVVTPAIAKSPLTVGAVGHGLSADTPSTFSSRGPVFDGRLKPTVAAQGEAVVSAASDAVATSNNCDSCSFDGSSMSAPITAGLAALVREYYTAGFYPTGSRVPADGFSPTGALLKATIIDGAVALGTAAPGPDFDSGYGRVLLHPTLALSGGTFELRIDDHRDGITTGSVVTHAYDVVAGEPFRATLVWTDYPAALNAAVARVNELKLEVIDPDSNVWFQTIDPGTGTPVQTSIDTDPHDHLNVEERLVFETPTPGRWVVRVIGVDVPWGPQPFALVVRGALSDCPAPAAPATPVLSTPAERQVQVSWSFVPGAAAYNVYRSLGSCPGGPWIPVATGETATSFLDTGVSGGAAYSYHVTVASDASSFCESTPSPCASVVPTGECTLMPDFRGTATAASDGTANCSITLDWVAATPLCGSEVAYNIYRDTVSGFTPGPANRITSCVGGTSYTDSADLAHGTDYYYFVSAEDGTSGHGGACHGGNETANATEITTSPFGPPQIGTWSDDAGDTGTAVFELGPSWTIDATGGDAGPAAYIVASSSLLCTDLVSPTMTLGPPSQAPQLSFSTRHYLDYDPGEILAFEGSLGQVEIAIGPDFSNWTRVPLTPDYPAYIDYPANICPTTQTIGNYFSDIDTTYSTYAASLTNWAGEDVKIRFHLSGDLYFSGGNWWIDDVQVTQVMVPGTCSAAATGPPPVPDGASVPGEPLRVGKSGGDLALTWDATSCPTSEINVYRGSMGDYSTFNGGDCGLSATGSATVSIPDGSWFLVVATDGASTDGSWSRDAAGNELSYLGSSTACPAITAHETNNGCP